MTYELLPGDFDAMQGQVLEAVQLVHPLYREWSAETVESDRLRERRLDDLLWSSGGHSRPVVPYRPLPWQRDRLYDAGGQVTST